MSKAKLGFPEGCGVGEGGLRKNALSGEGMDMFWNYTLKGQFITPLFQVKQRFD